jgi:hypothetical protein
MKEILFQWGAYLRTILMCALFIWIVFYIRIRIEHFNPFYKGCYSKWLEEAKRSRGDDHVVLWLFGMFFWNGMILHPIKALLVWIGVFIFLICL